MLILKGGQQLIILVDKHGASLIACILTTLDIIAFCWVYGVKRVCNDVYFMIQKETNFYWRFCWGIVAPLILIFVMVYTVSNFENLTYKDKQYPSWAKSMIDFKLIK